jgi:hypothetical protein
VGDVELAAFEAVDDIVGDRLGVGIAGSLHRHRVMLADDRLGIDALDPEMEKKLKSLLDKFLERFS